MRARIIGEEVEPPDIGKAEVEDDEIGLAVEQREGGLAVRRVEHLVALRAESPIRSSLRIGGSSSTISTFSGLALTRRTPAFPLRGPAGEW